MLLRMHWGNRVGVLAAALVPAAAGGIDASATAPPVSASVRTQIVASFGETYLPGWLPGGYVFSQWQDEPGSATAYGDSLVVVFGNHGDRLQWTVGSSADPDGYGHDACSPHPFDARIIRVGGRRIVFQSGNHGATATLCLEGTAVVVWNAHTLSPGDEAKVAASAVVVG